MKIGNWKLEIAERGEIATVLTILSFALMLAGVAVSSIASQKQTRLLTKAAADQCTATDIIDKKYLGIATEEGINGCACDETNKQKVVMRKSCDCAATGACPYVYPEIDSANYCTGKITCKFEDPSVTAKPTQASCATGEWSCKGQCADRETQELFNNTWCNGEKRWLYEAAGSNADCKGDASIPKSSTSCTGSSSSSPAENPTKAPNAGGFHLTSDIYAEKATDGIKFNVHAIFNFDGCDGDVTLFRDGTNLTGYKGWKGPGPKDYDQNVAGSFTLKKGESISPGYRGTVDHCPKSKVTLEDTISCKLAVDYSGNPGVFGAGCTFKDQANFPAYNPAAPTLGAPSGPGGKYRCQDLTDSLNKDCNDTMAGPCEYGTYKYKCTSTACPSDKSVGVGIPFWCDGDKWFDVNKMGECIGVCTPGGSPAPTPSPECQGKADGFVISSCVQQECEVPNKKWINLEKVCQGGRAYTKPGKLTNDVCNPQADKYRACPAGAAGAIGASGATGSSGATGATGPVGTGVTKEVQMKFAVQNLCFINLQPVCKDDYGDLSSNAETFLEKQGSGRVELQLMNHEGAPIDFPGPTRRLYTLKYKFELGIPYNATFRFKYKHNGVNCYNDKVENGKIFNVGSDDFWWVTLDIDRSKCGTPATTPAPVGQTQPPQQQPNNPPQQQPPANNPNQSPTCGSLRGRCLAGAERPFNPLCLKELLPPPAKGCGDGNGYIGPIAIGCYQCSNFKISTSSTNQAFQTAIDLYSQQKVTAKDISEFVSKLPNNTDVPAPHVKYCDPTRGECNLPEGPQPGTGAI